MSPTSLKTFAAESNIPIAHAGNVEEMAKSPFRPDSAGAQAYWTLFKNNFSKLYPVYQLVARYPASSSCLERIFSQISRKIGKNRTALKCEILVVMQQGRAQAKEFMTKLRELDQ